MTAHILATGFSVFPGAPENPTAWAISALQREGWQPAGARLTTRTLAVRYDVWERELAPLLAETNPDAVVAFGLSAKTTGITLESTARNRIATGRPDFAGATRDEPVLSSTGPSLLPTRLPLADMSLTLHNAKLPVVRSDDAGDYICNLLFYQLLTHAERLGLRAAGFVHVPYLDTQVARLAAQGRELAFGGTMREAELLEAVKLVLTCTAHVLNTAEAIV